MKSVLGKDYEVIKSKFLTGKYHESLQEIESIEQNKDTLYEDKVICNRLKSELFFIFQPFSKAIEYGEKALKGSIEIGNKFLIVDSAIHYGRALCITGKLDVGAEKLQLAQKTLDSIEDKESVEFLKRKALILFIYKGWRDGFEIVYEKLNQALSIAEKIGDEYLQVCAIYEISCLYQWYGDYHNASKYSRMCLKRAENFNFQEYIMWGLINLGAVHLYKGELEESLKIYVKALPLAEEMETYYALSFILGDIGFLYWQSHNLDRALDNYNKCLEGLRKTDNSIHRQYPWMLFRSILVLMEQNNFDKAQKNVEEIKSISDLQSYRPQHLSHKIYKISKAIILKTYSPEDNFIEITELLNEIAYDTLVHNELNKIALFHLCDLYFQKLIKTNDLEILGFIITKVKDLGKMAKEQDSLDILAETLLFESQLSLLELDMSEAKSLLNNAQKIAEDKGIYRLANLISNAYDNILDNLDQWKNTSSLLPDISERMELTHIEDLLYKLLRNKIIYSDVEQGIEQPTFFLITNQEGSLLFSENFNEKQMDTETISGILSFIQEEICEINYQSLISHRIRYNGYTIIVEKFKDFLFCYVFVGKSYLAMKKFQLLINDIQTPSVIWKNLLSIFENNTILNFENRIELSIYLQEIFVK